MGQSTALGLVQQPVCRSPSCEVSSWPCRVAHPWPQFSPPGSDCAAQKGAASSRKGSSLGANTNTTASVVGYRTEPNQLTWYEVRRPSVRRKGSVHGCNMLATPTPHVLPTKMDVALPLQPPARTTRAMWKPPTRLIAALTHKAMALAFCWRQQGERGHCSTHRPLGDAAVALISRRLPEGLGRREP